VNEIPNAPRLIADYLRANGFARVRSKAPADTDRSSAWIQLRVLDGTDQTEDADHLIGFLVQLDCYAGASGGQPEAWNNARTVRRLLKLMPEAEVDGAVVTAARLVNMAEVIDTDPSFEPARDRVILTARVYMHNAAAVSS
jgi:hypothetical protein